MMSMDWLADVAGVVSAVAGLGILTYHLVRYFRNRPRFNVEVAPDVATPADIDPSASDPSASNAGSSDSRMWISVRVTAKGRDLTLTHFFLRLDGRKTVEPASLYHTVDGRSEACTLPVPLERDETRSFLAEIPTAFLPRDPRRPDRTPPARVTVVDDAKGKQGTSAAFRLRRAS